MAQDIISIREKIAALGETADKDAITPAVLAQLLRDIVDIIPTEELPAERNNICLEVRGGDLYAYGSRRLLTKGFVPYLFRYSKTRAHYPGMPEKRKVSKGWHLFGSRHTVLIENNLVKFSLKDHNEIHMPGGDYSCDPTDLIRLREKEGNQVLGWGKSIISLADYKTGKPRMVKLRLALGFAKPINPSGMKLTPLNLVSNLAEFFIIYNPAAETFTLKV